MGRRKITIVRIQAPALRRSTFKKRGPGFLKKGHELHVLTGAVVKITVEFEGQTLTFDSTQDDVKVAAKAEAEDEHEEEAEDNLSATVNCEPELDLVDFKQDLKNIEQSTSPEAELNYAAEHLWPGSDSPEPATLQELDDIDLDWCDIEGDLICTV